MEALESAKAEVFEARKAGMVASFEVAQAELKKRADLIEKAEQDGSYLEVTRLRCWPLGCLGLPSAYATAGESPRRGTPSPSPPLELKPSPVPRPHRNSRPS